jgi:hypothetical protein
MRSSHILLARYTEKNCVLRNRVLSIARNARYVRLRERFRFIMLQNFKSLTWKFDISDVTHKCFLLTYIIDGNFSCQKYWNFVGNPVYFKVLCRLTWKIFMSYNMKLSFYMKWNFYVLGANRKVSCYITWNFYGNSGTWKFPVT